MGSRRARARTADSRRLRRARRRRRTRAGDHPHLSRGRSPARASAHAGCIRLDRRGRAAPRRPPPHLLPPASHRSAQRGPRAQRLRRAGAQGHGRPHQIQVRRVQRLRQRGADQPRPGGDHLRVQARSRHQVQPHHQPHRRPVPRVAGRIHPHRTHPRQADGGHRGPQHAPRADRPAPDAREPRSSPNPAPTSPSRSARTSTAASAWPRSKPCPTCSSPVPPVRARAS